MKTDYIKFQLCFYAHRNARASKISFQLEINSLSLFVNNNKTLGFILGSGEKGLDRFLKFC